MARKYWPGESPIGKRLGRTDAATPDWAEVVGVMSDFKGAADFYNPGDSSSKFLRPWARNNNRFISFHIRTAGDPAAMMDTVRKAMGQLSPDHALSQLNTVKEVLAGEVSYFTFLRKMLIQISVLGLLLTAVGIYGVVANLASERTREIGIRMALGAQPRGIVWLFLKNGIALALIGVGLGLAASFVLMSILKKMLPMIPGNDPRVVLGVALLPGRGRAPRLLASCQAHDADKSLGRPCGGIAFGGWNMTRCPARAVSAGHRTRIDADPIRPMRG